MHEQAGRARGLVSLDEQVPILGATSPRGERRSRAPIWATLLVSAALLALLLAGSFGPGGVAQNGRAGGDGAAAGPARAVAGKALPQTQFLAESAPQDGSIVATAKELTDDLHKMTAKAAGDDAHAKKLAKKAADEMKDGKAKVKAAKEEIAAAEASNAKAEEMQREAEEEIAKAKAMMKHSAQSKEHANGVMLEGRTRITDSNKLSTSAHAVHAKFDKEAEEAENLKKQEVEALTDEAKYLKGVADGDKQSADAALKAAKAKLDNAEDEIDKQQHILSDSMGRLRKAMTSEEKGKADITKAKVMKESAQHEKEVATTDKKQGSHALAAGKAAAKKSEDAQVRVEKETAKVEALEEQALHRSASHRTCVDIPGVRLREAAEASGFAPIAVERDVSTATKCSAWCQQHEQCVQATYSAGNTGCYLFTKATTEVRQWSDFYNTSYCSESKEKHHLTNMVKQVFSQKPTITEAATCSWAGDDCSQTKCCNDATCSWDLKGCKGYSCYQQHGGSSQCMETASWSTGTIIGGPRKVRKLAKADDGITVQGTSLFCFMVVYWKGKEGAIANNIKEKQLSIFQCDAHTILSGWETPKTPWSTYINADAFTKLWQQLQTSKQYLEHDWTVKVDADAVFFPHMLKMHLAALRTPQGAKVYLQNINFKFRFQGALEVLTREAVDHYFQKGGECAGAGKLLKSHPKAGEDFYMKTCLESIGVDTQEDFGLLRDGICGIDCPGIDGPCSDGWVVAYHFYRDVDSWNACHTEALNAQAAAGHDKAPTPKAPKEEILEASGGDAAAEAIDFVGKAADLNAKLAPDASAAKAMRESADKDIRAATHKIHDSQQRLIDAAANKTKAETLAQDAAERVKKAEATEKSSQHAAGIAAKAKAQGVKELETAKALTASAEDAEEKAKRARGAAAEVEDQMLGEVASGRICLSLPGVRLKSSGLAINPKPIAKTLNTSTPEKCMAWCREHTECRQSIFSAGNKGCYLFNELSGEPIDFKDSFNSSYCGDPIEKDHMVGLLKSVFKMKPWVPPLKQCSWAGEDCSQSKCCANAAVPNWHFTEFQWYQCKSEASGFHACKLEHAPSGVDFSKLSNMISREVPKAPEGVLTQGTSLFCFAVVCWDSLPKEAFWSSEADLANNIKKTGRSIMGCEDHAFFQGGGLSGGGDASSIQNIDAFINAWEQVRKDGRYLKHDWTIKVDADAVFFPERLRAHIRDLRTPKGSRVYLRNINFKFQFLGALEIFTKEALERYFEASGQCAQHVGHQGGEDYYMMACMDGIGVDHQTDFKLLNDKYAATGNCHDPWVVGFHFYKKVVSWNQCHDDAVKAAEASNMRFLEQ